jgi:hypothetical protein
MSKHRVTGANALWTGIGLGAIAGYVLTQQLWVLWQLARKNVERSLRDHRNKAARGLTFAETIEAEHWVKHPPHGYD